jgi:hypothetical protein
VDTGEKMPERDPLYRTPFTSKRIKDGLKALSLVGVSLALVGCGNKTYPYKPAKRDAVAKYKEAFQSASPAGKFTLQYLRITKVQERYKDAAISDSDRNYEIDINNGCLFNSAYDIAGGKISGSFTGAFSSGSIKGNSPTAAANAVWSRENPDMLTIQPGHPGSKDLHFTGIEGEGSRLAAADRYTEDILATYGCKTGVTGHTSVLRYGKHSSPWIGGGNFAS